MKTLEEYIEDAYEADGDTKRIGIRYYAAPEDYITPVYNDLMEEIKKLRSDLQWERHH